jgi:predicted transposase YbfD/YdcC
VQALILLPVLFRLWFNIRMKTNSSSPQLKDHFVTIAEPRTGPAQLHELLDILMIAICARLCGADSFTDIALWGRCQQDWLKTWLSLPHGIPSHDTFNRVFGLIKPAEFAACFQSWTEALRQTVAGEVIAIDGKTLRGSRSKTQGPLHLVNVWASTNRLVLAQLAVDDKSNEITAVPQLLRALELSGCIVTVDALNCQKNIAKEISEADADYVLALKGNHGTLHDEVKTFLDDARQHQFQGVPHSFVKTTDKEHGRLETRRYWITEDIDWLADKPQWEKLRSIGLVERVVEVDGKVQTERAYYLSSLAAEAERFAGAVRGHWGVENSVHWVLDVQMNEDACRVRDRYATQNLATLRVFCLNLLRRDQQHKVGVRAKQKAAGWSPQYLLSLLKF